MSDRSPMTMDLHRAEALSNAWRCALVALVRYRSSMSKPETAVAANVTGGRDPTRADNSLGPGVAPNTQLPAVATPSEPVVAGDPVTEPPPDVTEKVTETPETGVPAASTTRTAGLTGTAAPAGAVCPSPETAVTAAGDPSFGFGPAGSLFVHATMAVLSTATRNRRHTPVLPISFENIHHLMTRYRFTASP
jgi:hypothetical protein